MIRLAAAGVAACFSLLGASADGSRPLPRSGLYGVVERGPIHPVCIVGVPCDEPAAHVTLVFSKPGTTVRTKTDARGRYRVRLRPGRYAVRKPDWGPGSVEPARVRVPAGRFARVNFFVDTGIR